MNRVVLVLVVMAFSTVCWADSTDTVKAVVPKDTSWVSKTGSLEFGGIVQVPGLSGRDLYSRLEVWFAQSFKSANNVLQVRDKESCTLVGSALFRYYPVVLVSSTWIQGVVRYDVKMECREGRFKYTVGNFCHEGKDGRVCFGVVKCDTNCPVSFGLTGPGPVGSQITWEDLQKKCRQEAGLLVGRIKSVKEGKPSAESGPEDW